MDVYTVRKMHKHITLMYVNIYIYIYVCIYMQKQQESYIPIISDWWIDRKTLRQNARGGNAVQQGFTLFSIFLARA